MVAGGVGEDFFSPNSLSSFLCRRGSFLEQFASLEVLKFPPQLLGFSHVFFLWELGGGN